MSEDYSRKPNTKCKTCGKAIYKRPAQINSGRIFCSMKCYGLDNRKENPCVVCGKLIMSQFNKKTCSRGCANKHRAGIKYRLNQPRDKVKTLRALKIKLLKVRGGKCERCGYDKIEIIEVHHKDRNTNNNDLSNLELICPNCHREEHLLEKSWLKIKYGGVA